MKQKLICKGLAVAVIVLFIGLAIQPSVATVQPKTEIDIEPKDYLFQTIIDIANNPNVKELFEQYKPDLFKVDIDRRVYRKLLLRNPRLMFNSLFTKPSMSVEYLDKCYNNGIEITNVLGEDKALEIVESIDISDLDVLDELYNIIMNNEELSGRLATLKEMNKDYIYDLPWDFPIICTIVEILFIPLAGLFAMFLFLLIFSFIGQVWPELIPYFAFFALILFIPFIILSVIGLALGCDIVFPYFTLN